MRASADAEAKFRKTFHALDLQHQIEYGLRCDAMRCYFSLLTILWRRQKPIECTYGAANDLSEKSFRLREKKKDWANSGTKTRSTTKVRCQSECVQYMNANKSQQFRNCALEIQLILFTNLKCINSRMCTSSLTQRKVSSVSLSLVAWVSLFRCD